MKRIALLLVTFFITTAAFAANPQGFVWANQETSPSYAPNASYAHNSTGGAVKITRTAAGAYTVLFAGLGAAGAAMKSNVQVTAYNGRTACNVVSWSGSPDLSVKVHCFYIPDGSMRDSQFTALVTFAP
ncbi:MAG TPA: hypothetical protein VGF69_18140 [Thermoanaerobaculia bacterium]|jgi:hypothetical protein